MASRDSGVSEQERLMSFETEDAKNSGRSSEDVAMARTRQETEFRERESSMIFLPMHAMSPMNVVMFYESHEEDGLNSAQVTKNQEKMGDNILNNPRPCCRCPCLPRVRIVQMPATVWVTRDGKKATEVDTQQLVPGDLVHIKAGDVIPADIRIIGDDAKLMMNNMNLTGNAAPIHITSEADHLHPNPEEASNVAFCGTTCIKGAASGIVIRTGRDTVMGVKLRELEENTPSCAIL